MSLPNPIILGHSYFLLPGFGQQPVSTLNVRQRKLAGQIKAKWVHNGLRHGYGTCRVALTKNYPQVAYEMGNSVEVIKSCYDQVVSEKEANAWFSICPKMPGNVIRLATAD